MNSKTLTSQKIGLVVFAIGGLYMFGLGWLIGFIFFVVAAWYLCGVFGIGNFVLRPELADRFSVPVGSTINAASVVMVLLVLGWGFTYVGQLVSRPVPALEPEIEKVPQIVPAD
jgi:hypothetical protein